MHAYLDLLRDIRDHGAVRTDRTGTGTRSLFGRQLRFNLSDGFPLLTTKKVHFKSVANELIWFLNGDTNTEWLKEHGVSIWDEWATEQGELGPLYGAQWRRWPTRDGREIDQLAYVLDCLKNRPDSRRILFHGWNVEYLPDETLSPQENVLAGRMALPPCHLLYQFYVVDGKLSTLLFIRSSDTFLGLPFNIASVALLTHMLAQQAGLGVAEVVVSIGDAHIYSNHVEQVEEQLSRSPGPPPTLQLLRQPTVCSITATRTLPWKAITPRRISLHRWLFDDGLHDEGENVPVILVLAVSENGVIGRGNALPWDLPDDLQHFKRATMGCPILMGRKTFESVGRPLPGRTNLVLTRDAAWQAAGVSVFANVDEALARAEAQALIDGAPGICVVGGAEIYRLCLPRADRILLTLVHGDISGDATFDLAVLRDWHEESREHFEGGSRNSHDFSVVEFVRCG